eukprot:4380874-Karenia_brevis.AAC.1
MGVMLNPLRIHPIYCHVVQALLAVRRFCIKHQHFKEVICEIADKRIGEGRLKGVAPVANFLKVIESLGWTWDGSQILCGHRCPLQLDCSSNRHFVSKIKYAATQALWQQIPRLHKGEGGIDYQGAEAVSYTHLRAHETLSDL